MGNWRSVSIEGACAASDVPALRAAVKGKSDYSDYHPLIGGGGVCGLAVWASEKISAAGNLAERGYSVQDVADTLEKLAKVAPSLSVRVHCGGDYEDKTCIATVTLVAGKAVVGPPLVEQVAEVSDAQMESNMRELLAAQGFRL